MKSLGGTALADVEPVNPMVWRSVIVSFHRPFRVWPDPVIMRTRPTLAQRFPRRAVA